MKNMEKFLLGITLSISTQASLADDKFANNEKSSSPSALLVYKTHDGNYIQMAEAKRVQLFINQLQDSILAADPTPQPSINSNLVIENIPYNLVYDLYKSNINIQVKTTCDLIGESFIDRYGNLLKPQSQAQKAINCGCEMIDQGFGIADSQIHANNVFHYGKVCPL